jgi:hypothetical protein
MFQPTNESYVKSLVEATIDRHAGESEVERVMREEQPYRQSSPLFGLPTLLAFAQNVLGSIGSLVKRSKPHKTILSHHQIASR